LHHKTKKENNGFYSKTVLSTLSLKLFSIIIIIIIRDKWVHVATAWRVLRLGMEKRPPIWRVVANILNKQSQTADKGLSSSLGVERGVNNSSPSKRKLLRNIHTGICECGNAASRSTKCR